MYKWWQLTIRAKYKRWRGWRGSKGEGGEKLMNWSLGMAGWIGNEVFSPVRLCSLLK